MIVALVGCGPSALDVKTAKTAVYRVEPHQLLRLAEEATRGEYRIRDVDEAGYMFRTDAKLYGTDGLAWSMRPLNERVAGPGPDGNGKLPMPPGMVSLSFVVRLVIGENQQVVVSVIPKTLEGVEGGTGPREIEPDDPSLPPFVKDRADALALAIYNHAKPDAGK